MARFDAKSAQCLVFTYKDGLLSAMAHDLKIRVTAFVIDVDENTRAITASFSPTSLRVVSAMRNGRETPGDLSADNKREIEGNIARDVLQASRYPEIQFTSSSVEEKGERYLVRGALALHGHRRTIAVEVHRRDDHYIAEGRIHQPTFGIRPYSAMFGTLKVKPDVVVQVRVPAPS